MNQKRQEVVSFCLSSDIYALPQFAVSNRFKNRSGDITKREHWLDWAAEKYPVSWNSKHICASVVAFLMFKLILSHCIQPLLLLLWGTSTPSRKTMSGNLACSFFPFLVETAHYGCESTDQNTIPLYPIAHVLGSFGTAGKKSCFESYPFFQPLPSYRKGISHNSICLSLGLTMDLASHQDEQEFGELKRFSREVYYFLYNSYQGKINFFVFFSEN